MANIACIVSKTRMMERAIAHGSVTAKQGANILRRDLKDCGVGGKKKGSKAKHHKKAKSHGKLKARKHTGRKLGHKKGSTGGRRALIGRKHCGINIGPARRNTKGLTCNGSSKKDCKKVGGKMSRKLKGNVRVVCA